MSMGKEAQHDQKEVAYFKYSSLQPYDSPHDGLCFCRRTICVDDAAAFGLGNQDAWVRVALEYAVTLQDD